MKIRNECKNVTGKIFSLIISAEAYRVFGFIFSEKNIDDDDFDYIADLCFSPSFPDETPENLLKKLDASFVELELLKIIDVVRDCQGNREEIIIKPEENWLIKNEIDPINLDIDF